MKSPHQLATVALFFGGASFFAGVLGHAVLCIAATFAMVILALLALFAWNEKMRFRAMRIEGGLESDLETIRRAKAKAQAREDLQEEIDDAARAYNSALEQGAQSKDLYGIEELEAKLQAQLDASELETEDAA